ncbi:GTP-binding protein [Paenibacillus macerans]|uniref:CobW family GTP-binding protein n=1 Tax=Paenibacillus macerans TaxID=44252 RepID=UPI000EC57A5D|nr:GTP-binding protein [Paenibacillus macerans]MEC0137981.1 GTP-binding protein [Paenibacillus macerans]GBK63045.1 GTP-binding protein [Paenibacillus macerans]GBK69358.1 GTP-binding protein [Paenibacillus macerans]
MKTPVIIISGFLGSGKTTLLLELIKTLHGRNLGPAILMNELGKADVDGRILSEAVQGLPLEKLFDGCICCSKKSEIAGSLKGLLALAPDVILVELTGVANPEEVVDAMAEPALLNEVILHKIITVIDAENALEYNSIFASDKQLVHTLRRQLEVADVILVNKQDLVSDSHLSKVTRLIQKHNEQAAVFNTTLGKFSPEAVMEGLEPLNRQAKTSGRLKIAPVRHPHQHGGDSASSAGQGNASFSRIQSVFIPINGQTPISLKKLEKWLKAKGKHILRAKGYVCLEGSQSASLIQFAGKRTHHERTEYQGPYYLVIIGYELDEPALLAEWRAGGFG